MCADFKLFKIVRLAFIPAEDVIKIKNALIICAALLLINVISCKKNEVIIVWSLDDEVEGIINNYYLKDNPDFKFNYFIKTADQFSDLLDPAFDSGRTIPDVIVLNSDFVRKYAESGLLLDITGIYERNKSKLIAYPVETGTYNNKVYSMSWQACPGAVFYRRSLAKKYIGTDNPAIVQAYFSDFNIFLETAKLVKIRSDNSCVIVTDSGDLYNAFLGARNAPWIVNNSLVIDPVMNAYMDIKKTFYENNYDARVKQWSEDWTAGMNDILFDEEGKQLEVFSYFLPAMDLHRVMKSNAESTSGDWAVIPGPAFYHWGGKWLGAWKNTKTPGAAKKLIEYITANNDFLSSYAQDSGDIVSNTEVINQIQNSFSEPFLDGQNYYLEFAAMALNIDGKLVQMTDKAIQDIFSGEVDAYIKDEKTKDEALADFIQQVNVLLGLD